MPEIDETQTETKQMSQSERRQAEAVAEMPAETDGSRLFTSEPTTSTRGGSDE